MEFLQKHDKSLFTFFLLCILLAVTALFLWNISDQGYWMDELYHVLGAKYILTEGAPVFPTGDTYTRALAYTYMVALSFKLFGISELTGRLPSLLFMLIFLVSSGYFIKRRLGTYPAMLFLLAMALSPLSIELVRYSRMYTAFAFFYFFAAWSFFYGFERDSQEQRNSFWSSPLFAFELKTGINLKLLLLSGALFSISLHLQTLTLTFLAAMGGYIFLKFLDQIIQTDFLIALRSKYGVITLLGISFILGMLIFSPETLTKIHGQLTSKLFWAQQMDFDSGYYRHFLAESYPFFFFSYPVAAIYLIHKHKNIGLFLLSNFLILLLLHSYVIEMKQLRYLYYILPFFFMTIVLFSVDLVKHVWNQFKELPKFHLAWVKGCCLIAIVIFLNVFTYPWLNDVKKVPLQHPDVNWKTFAQKVRPLMDPKIPVLATDQLPYLYYFDKKPDYYMRLNYYDNAEDTEHYAGSIPITSYEELKNLSEREPNLYIVSKRAKLNYYVYSNKAIRQYIKENFELVDLGDIETLQLYKKKNQNPIEVK